MPEIRVSAGVEKLTLNTVPAALFIASRALASPCAGARARRAQAIAQGAQARALAQGVR